MPLSAGQAGRRPSTTSQRGSTWASPCLSDSTAASWASTWSVHCSRHDTHTQHTTHTTHQAHEMIHKAGFKLTIDVSRPPTTQPHRPLGRAYIASCRVQVHVSGTLQRCPLVPRGSVWWSVQLVGAGEQPLGCAEASAFGKPCVPEPSQPPHSHSHRRGAGTTKC
jgi:hypothetical protein